jgi:hypothetical protein
MTKKIALIVTICCSFFSYSQEKEPKRLEFAFSPGIIVQRNVFLDANILIGKTTVDLNPKFPTIWIQGVRIGLETDCNKTFAPKIGYEFTPMIFSSRISAINYFQNGNSELRIIPELGLSFYSWINLTYGYGISLNDGNLTDIGHHRVSLTFNFNKKLSRKYLEKLFNEQEAKNSNPNAD